ncbi:MAG: XisI protein [Saprospiraceae bacterium]
MDKITQYGKILREVLQEYATDRSGHPQPTDVNLQLLFDTTGHHYQVLHMGWRGEQQTFVVVFHFDIKDGKIWVQRNISDYDIVGDLELKGVPKEDIVLGFHSPYIRQFTEYAVA